MVARSFVMAAALIAIIALAGCTMGPSQAPAATSAQSHADQGSAISYPGDAHALVLSRQPGSTAARTNRAAAHVRWFGDKPSDKSRYLLEIVDFDAGRAYLALGWGEFYVSDGDSLTGFSVTLGTLGIRGSIAATSVKSGHYRARLDRGIKSSDWTKWTKQRPYWLNIRLDDAAPPYFFKDGAGRTGGAQPLISGVSFDDRYLKLQLISNYKEAPDQMGPQPEHKGSFWIDYKGANPKVVKSEVDGQPGPFPQR